MADDCLYVDVSCTNAGCSLKMERRFMEEHKNKLCEQRVVQCDLCLQENLAFQLQVCIGLEMLLCVAIGRKS